MKNGTLKYRVGQLEGAVKSLEGRMDKLMENHLPHLQKDIATMKTEIRIWAAINIGAILLAKFFL